MNSQSPDDRPWLSIIIPSLNEAATIPALLRKLSPDPSFTAIELILSDGGSADDTRQIARQHGVKIIAGAPGRARQLNAGAAAARGQYFWFLHADTLPPDDWLDQLKRARHDSYPASFALRFDRQSESWWLRRFAEASQLNLMAFRFGDQSLFVSGYAFRKAGGYQESLPLMEGHELARRLRKQEGGFSLLPGPVTTSARRYFRYGVLYTQSVFILIFILFYCGVSQQSLSWLYHRAFPKSS